jgi:hypothetical protein
LRTDTRILCEISSDLSTASEKRFIEKNKYFWSLGKHYFKVEYQVRVLIGPADIRFELWFDNQKLSRDQSIKVEWKPASSAPPGPSVDLATYNRVELPDSHPTHMSGGLAGMNGNAGTGAGRHGHVPANGLERSGTAVIDKAANADDRKKGRGLKSAGGLLGRARGGK